MKGISYSKVYNELNDSQKKAVNHIEGPVLVIAGPGTGKTQILAARIANILQQTDLLPENILCLTYTDAGTIAMRRRLNSFIGPDSYRVPVFTFHAFCHKVIQDNLDYFGIKALDAVSQLEQKSFIRELIDAFPKSHPLKRYSGEVYYEGEKLLNLYAAMKKEDWQPTWLISKIEEYVKSLETRDEHIYKRDSKYGKKGELKKSYHEELKRMTQLKAAVLTFDEYELLLRKNNRYDFADMILWVIKAFKDNPAILSNYQEQFQYFLVDEFQDTSGSQNHLLELLISYWDVPNIFCVGDDDQSIFRFQGANVQNIQEYVTKNQPYKISLTDNYRSSQYILDAARICIANNETRIDPDKVLVAKNEKVAKSKDKPAVVVYPNQMQESVDIAMQIEALVASGVSGSEIAVIYRKHQQSEQMIEFLRGKGIAITTRKRVNILEEPLIKQLKKILTYLAAENKKPHTGEVHIFEILHYQFLQLDPIRIAKISLEVYRKNFKERTTSWREELKKFIVTKQDLFNTSDVNDRFNNASELIENWIAASFNLTIQQLLQKIVNESGILVQALTSVDKTWNMQLLHTFFDFIKTECSRNPKTNLQQLIKLFELMEDERVDIPIQQILFSENGVNFMTAHGAKGLEFEYVFLIGCNSNKWESARDPNKNFKLPDNLFEVNSIDEVEEGRRLFYVALTRAKQFLSISYANSDNSGKELEMSRFVAELLTAENITEVKKEVSDDKMLEFELENLTLNQVPNRVNLFNNEFVDELLQDFSLSVTHLNSYLKCPTTYYFNNLIRVPAPLSPSMTFGSAMHYALEQLFKKMNNHPQKEFASANDLLEDFKWYMKRNEDAYTDADYKRRLEYGEEIIPAYYNNYIHEWNKITSVERSYRNVVVDGVPLNGKLDKLEFDGNIVNVVDYKTGNYANSKKKFKRPNPDKVSEKEEKGKDPDFEDKFGGDYWRQAVFYKLLMDYDKTKNWEMRTAEFDFIEPDKDSKTFYKERVPITSDDLEIVKHQIHFAYDSIFKKEFENGCGKEDCTWCNFVKEYYDHGKVAKLSLNKEDE